MDFYHYSGCTYVLNHMISVLLVVAQQIVRQKKEQVLLPPGSNLELHHNQSNHLPLEWFLKCGVVCFFINIFSCL
jgi:hypothetical protein